MGAGQSGYGTPNLSGEITLNRIRDACQVNSSLSPELRRFQIRILANDFNALGMKVPVTDERGRPLSDEDICTNISRRSVPNVEDVCMLHRGRGKRDVQTLVEKMVKHFNEHYGARISIYKNPMDHSRGRREVAELCDDLYMVADKVYRGLVDEPKIIKAQLKKSLSNLAQQKALLEAQFNRTLGNLAQAKAKDKSMDQLKVAQTMQDVVLGNLNQQLRNTYAQFASLEKEFQGPYAAQVNAINGDLNQYDLMGFGQQGQLPFAESSYKLGPLLSVMQRLPVAVNTCQNCLRKYNMSVTDYSALRNTPDFPLHLQKKYLELRRSAANKGDRATLDQLNKCYTQLLHRKDECSSAAMDSRIGRDIIGKARTMTKNTISEALRSPAGVAKIIQQLQGNAPIATATATASSNVAADVANLSAEQAAAV